MQEFIVVLQNNYQTIGYRDIHITTMVIEPDDKIDPVAEMVAEIPREVFDAVPKKVSQYQKSVILKRNIVVN